MQIDWFTVVAQIINFLILAYILKRLLYSRVVRAMDEREEKISSRLEEAKETKKKAEATLEEYMSKLEKIESERDEIIGSAKKEAEEKRKELLKEAKSEVEEKKRNWGDYLDQEKASFLETIRERVATEVMSVSRQVLSELANAELEKEAITNFLKSIEDVSGDEIESLAEKDNDSQSRVTVVSGFDLDDDSRKKIKDKIGKKFEANIELEFETSEELVAGIQLRGGGHKIGWSVLDYLEEMEERISTLIKEEAREQKSGDRDETRASREDSGKGNDGGGDPSSAEDESEGSSEESTDESEAKSEHKD
jgi:F-type H+-transporting ATPase subunit b